MPGSFSLLATTALSRLSLHAVGIRLLLRGGGRARLPGGGCDAPGVERNRRPRNGRETCQCRYRLAKTGPLERRLLAANQRGATPAGRTGVNRQLDANMK